MDPKNVIVGAGICGIATARILQQKGVPFLLIDELATPGGRLQTDNVDGFLLDHGFQVLNTAYPEFKKQSIALEELTPGYFSSGARILKNGKKMMLADPVRERKYRFKSVFSGAASFLDLYRMNRLSKDLLSTHADMPLWSGKSTMSYLRSKGFSNKVIQNFFQPFFSGVFLENDLSTDSGFFEFMFRIFGHGHAALPAEGMNQLARLLLKDIPEKSIWTGVSVAHAEKGRLLLADGREMNPEKVIFTTGTRPFKPAETSNVSGCRSTSVLYFEAMTDPGLGTFITLNANQGGMVHSISQLSAAQKSYAPEGKHLLSVSLIPGIKYAEGMESAVSTEIEQLLGTNHNLRFIKAYWIPRALPVLKELHAEPQILKPYEGALAAGDFTAYPSLNSALQAGRLLAMNF